MRIPVIAKLRETQSYVKSSEQGLGIHELSPKTDARGIENWRKIIHWYADQQTNELKVVVDNA